MPPASPAAGGLLPSARRPRAAVGLLLLLLPAAAVLCAVSSRGPATLQATSHIFQQAAAPTGAHETYYTKAVQADDVLFDVEMLLKDANSDGPDAHLLAERALADPDLPGTLKWRSPWAHTEASRQVRHLPHFVPSPVARCRCAPLQTSERIAAPHSAYDALPGAQVEHKKSEIKKLKTALQVITEGTKVGRLSGATAQLLVVAPAQFLFIFVCTC